MRCAQGCLSATWHIGLVNGAIGCPMVLLALQLLQLLIKMKSNWSTTPEHGASRASPSWDRMDQMEEQQHILTCGDQSSTCTPLHIVEVSKPSHIHVRETSSHESAHKVNFHCRLPNFDRSKNWPK